MTTVVVFLPLAFVRGVSGVLFRELALVVSVSLVVSLLAALSIVPMLSSRLPGGSGASAGGGSRLLRSLSTAAGGAVGGLERLYLGLLGSGSPWRCAASTWPCSTPLQPRCAAGSRTCRA